MVVGVAALGAAFAFFRPKSQPGADDDDHEDPLLRGEKGGSGAGARAGKSGGAVSRTED